ncbi:creatininase family protein [Leptolyngbya cf. ectocarpi LEGE 11479]|uniref:Creatininase family protein n=1 Tax=Leptolyngbya cf. ectocarpi LEGE 11479 TaxID=1828722 RepID=A0A929F940_LEPEC|nr:creatininase family protein [Leptolyngbya ectocarpi]MBE9069650.1 creatininase family protein [Leptolyngbya cf. ectocarpi LEGE 11479]
MHQTIPPERFYPYLTWQDVDQMANKEQAVIIQPVGAIEQHGPHLPLAVDTALGMAVIGRALEQLDLSVPVYCLPPLCYGKSNEHWGFPGTVTLSASTLMAVLSDVAESLYQAGFRKLVLLNSHGGQPQVLEIVARDVHQRRPDFWVFPHFVWQVPHQVDELLSDQEQQEGIHAGDAETSLMLAILPDQVRMEQAVKEYPPKCEGLLSLEGALPFSWTTRDISQSGVVGDATVATAAKGEKIWADVAASWVTVLEEIYRFEPPQRWHD